MLDIDEAPQHEGVGSNGHAPPESKEGNNGHGPPEGREDEEAFDGHDVPPGSGKVEKPCEIHIPDSEEKCDGHVLAEGVEASCDDSDNQVPPDSEEESCDDSDDQELPHSEEEASDGSMPPGSSNMQELAALKADVKRLEFEVEWERGRRIRLEGELQLWKTRCYERGITPRLALGGPWLGTK